MSEASTATVQFVDPITSIGSDRCIECIVREVKTCKKPHVFADYCFSCKRSNRSCGYNSARHTQYLAKNRSELISTDDTEESKKAKAAASEEQENDSNTGKNNRDHRADYKSYNTGSSADPGYEGPLTSEYLKDAFTGLPDPEYYPKHGHTS